MSEPAALNNVHATHQHNPTPAFPWLRHYEPGVPAHLDMPDHPLTWLLDSAASHFPGQTASIYFDAKLSYAQLSSMANRFAVALQRLGIQKGDRVALALPNIPQYPIAFYGALRAGAVVVPTNPLYTEREMRHQLADSGARIVIMLDSYYPVVRAIREQTALEHVIVTSPADLMPPLKRTFYPLTQRRARVPEPRLSTQELHDDPMLHGMMDMLQTHTKGGVELYHLPTLNSSDLAVLQYTGGTTGLSKGAMLTHRNLLSNALQTRHWTPQVRTGQETILCAAPFFHSYGLTVCMNVAILVGATMILMPRFKAHDAVQTILRYRPTLFPGIPTMYTAILQEIERHPRKKPVDLSSINYCISGASPLPAKLQADFEAMTHGRLVEGYGLSEASPVTHCNPLTEERRNGSIGLPLPDVEAAIISPHTGERLPPGAVGEIIVRGPNIMQGYWQRAEETKAIFTADGWMRTGDLGKMDEDGYFYVVDRAKDMIIASGFNVYPREVEEVLFQHPAVAEAAAIGIPDEYRGETIAAFVVLKTGYEPNEQTREEILAFCKKNLAAYKRPKILEFRQSLPKSTIGKILRRELRVTRP